MYKRFGGLRRYRWRIYDKRSLTFRTVQLRAATLGRHLDAFGAMRAVNFDAALFDDWLILDRKEGPRARRADNLGAVTLDRHLDSLRAMRAANLESCCDGFFQSKSNVRLNAGYAIYLSSIGEIKTRAPGPSHCNAFATGKTLVAKTGKMLADNGKWLTDGGYGTAGFSKSVAGVGNALARVRKSFAEVGKGVSVGGNALAGRGGGLAGGGKMVLSRGWGCG